MTIIEEWTGRHARALQAAMRLTNEAFAEYLGIAPRTVSKWRRRPEMVPSQYLQEALDTTLRRTDAETQARFAANLGLPAPPVAVSADGAMSKGEEGLEFDPSFVDQLYSAVGELTRVLSGLPTRSAPATSTPADSPDEFQAGR
ncbi:hypothetical protein FB561_7544 [Kribbella amoyensis]|uniref:Uncharacterized protein n=1 Tax=Kribbella amoyensis TaxID=996641 RepID=A0A561B135_9ACTN|nr:XRE family transcriptional regulator [Kribbella amoyensis]TWD72552.1 hypothetical protein FB561_7544 [Kribbella amoyensis]